MNKKTLGILISLFILTTIFYLFTWLPRTMIKYPGLINNETIINMTTTKFKYLLVIITSVSLISVSSLVFQTMSESKILTPNILGFDSLYITIQTLIVFISGTESIFYNNAYANFGINTIVMCFFSVLMFKFVLKKGNNNIYILLMVGMILGVLFRNVSSFMQIIMSPENFDAVQSSSAASIRSVNLNIFYIMLPVFFIIMYIFFHKRKEYDVISLGKENSINLGINYVKNLNYTLFLISLATALSTALIGPFSFLGLLSVNIAREITRSYKHSVLIISSSLIGCISILLGQVLVEEFIIIPNLESVISLIGGIYIIRTILKESKI